MASSSRRRRRPAPASPPLPAAVPAALPASRSTPAAAATAGIPSPRPPLAAGAAARPRRTSESRGQGLILVLIMRNEARCIARCLASVRPWVDRMVVLDTGSTDASIALARSAGAEVHQAVWPDDFAKARNLALDLAGDYRYALILDADEWLEEGGQALADFVANAEEARATAPGLPLGVVRIDNRFEEGGVVRTAPAWLTRLLPTGVRYGGRIHEQPVAAGSRLRLPVTIGHDGYCPAPLAAKQGRNRQLLQAALVEDPDDAYLHYQLGKDFAVHEEWAAAADALAQAREQADPGSPWYHDLVIRSLISCNRAKRHHDAWALAEAEAGRWQNSPDFHFTVGDLALDCAVADPARAIETYFPLIEHHWLQALAIGDQPDLEGSVVGHGSHLAAHNLAVYYRLTGDEARARHYEGLGRQLSQPNPAP